jgi:hypothetical protein
MHNREIALQPVGHFSSRPSLPSNFAMTIIEKEIELDKAASKAVVADLVELYSQAIEFYNYNNDPKCYDYQDRMHKMLLKPFVVSLLSNSPTKSSSSAKSPSPQSHKQDLEKSRKLMAAELSSTFAVTTHKTERNITRAIDAHETSVKELAVQVADNFKQQNNGLSSRLESRRRLNKTFQSEYSVMDTSANLSYALEPVESDKSGGIAVNKAEMNRKVEELMEKHFAEKAARIAEISVKYEKEIMEMQEDGVMALVVAQMRENMKEEIEAASKEFDDRRRMAVAQLKKEFQ